MKRLLGTFILLLAITSCDDIITPPPLPEPEDTTYIVPLSGANEVPAGDPEGAGRAQVVISGDKKEICWEVSFSDIDNPTAAHIHAGGKGLNGPSVLVFEPFPKGCSAIDSEVVEAMLKGPEGYYINIRTPEFPEGAIRGQLKE